jgi:hypothetical protein
VLSELIEPAGRRRVGRAGVPTIMLPLAILLVTVAVLQFIQTWGDL